MSLEIAVTICLFVAGGFIGWLFRIDRLITKVVANQDNGEKQFHELRTSNLAEFSKLWSSHSDTIKDVSSVREQLAGMKAVSDVADRITEAIRSMRQEKASARK